MHQAGNCTVSALGQKQTFAPQNVMSALQPKADICSATVHVCFGPIADIVQHGGDVRFVPKAEVTPLFDHLVGQHEEVVWHFDPERPRGGEIDDEMEFGRLLDWEIAGLGPAQNLVHILSGAPE